MQFLPHVDVRVVFRFSIPEIEEYFIKVETALAKKVDIFTISRIHILHI